MIVPGWAYLAALVAGYGGARLAVGRATPPQPASSTTPEAGAGGSAGGAGASASTDLWGAFDQGAAFSIGGPAGGVLQGVRPGNVNSFMPGVPYYPATSATPVTPATPAIPATPVPTPPPTIPTPPPTIPTLPPINYPALPTITYPGFTSPIPLPTSYDQQSLAAWLANFRTATIQPVP